MNQKIESMEEMNIPDKMNIFKRVGSLFFSPSKLFLFIKKKPTVLFPIILMCIGAVLMQLLLWEPTKSVSLDAMYNSYKSMGISYSPDQVEQLLNISMIGMLIMVPVMYLLVWMFMTLILYLVYRLVKCEKGLKKYFSMMGYIIVITLAGQLINSAYIYYTAASITGPTVTSLASFLAPEMQGTFLYGVASGLEVFNMWTFILCGIGFAYTGNVDKKKSYIVTAVLFVVVILASAGMSLLSAGIQNNMLGSFMGT